MSEAAFLCLADVPVDVDQLGLNRDSIQGRNLCAERRHSGHLALAEDQHPLGVRDDRCDVRSDVVLVVAEANHQRRIEARADEQLGVVGREHGQRIRAVEALERGPHGGQEVTLVVGLDEVRDDFRVGLGSELVTLSLQLGLELGEVLDDAVVDDEDLAVAVGVRVCVDVGRLAVRRPARVADAELARRHVRLELLDEGVHLLL